MKKTILIALAGMMLFAFTQCGGTKGSKEYKEAKAFFNKMEKSIKQAKDCDQLHEAALSLFDNVLEDKEFSKDEQMTEDEKKLIQQQWEQIDELAKKKMEELGCEPIKLF